MKKVLLTSLLVILMLLGTACGKLQSDLPAVPNVTQTPGVAATDPVTPIPSVNEAQEITPTNVVDPTPMISPKSTPSATSAPVPNPTATPQRFPSTDVAATFFSKEDFHRGVNASKAEFASSDRKSAGNLQDINQYVDFKSIKKEWELFEIQIESVYVAFDYSSTDKKKSDDIDNLIIQWDRPVYATEYNYVEFWKNAYQGAIDMKINGNLAVKKEVYWNFEPYNNQHVCNQYHWTQDGMNVFLVIPAWLLEQYPEEDFFDIQVVTVPKG